MQYVHNFEKTDHFKNRSIENIIENRNTYYFDYCEFNLYETFTHAKKVGMTLPGVTLTAMLSGKKVMHMPFIKNSPEVDYLPGQMIIIPENERFYVDFPIATEANPTKCLAISIEKRIIDETLDRLNEKYNNEQLPMRADLDMSQIQLDTNIPIRETLQKLTQIAKDNITPTKVRKMLSDLTLKELIIHLMQTQSRVIFLENYQKNEDSRISDIVRYIHKNLTENITIDDLSKVACMSKANFYRLFKKQFGIAPIDLVIQERIKMAKHILKDENKSVTEACFSSGFNNQSHFYRLFKKMEGVTPRHFQKSVSEQYN